MLLVSAYNSTTARILAKPRTVNCRRFQLRQRAWIHSQMVRVLYCALPASLPIRARHAAAPTPFAATRQIRISAVLGLGRRTEHLDALVVRPLDFVGIVVSAIDKMALRQVAGRLQCLQHRPHQHAVGAVILDCYLDDELLAGRTCDL